MAALEGKAIAIFADEPGEVFGIFESAEGYGVNESVMGIECVPGAYSMHCVHLFRVCVQINADNDCEQKAVKERNPVYQQSPRRS